MEKNPLKFFTVEDCFLCDCKGKIFVLDEYENEEEKDCPACDSKGAIHRYK